MTMGTSSGGSILTPFRARALGLAVFVVAFAGFVLGPTVIDPHGDGLWYGVLTFVAGFRLGLGSSIEG